MHGVGHYCGRFGPGLFGEPQNLLTNLAFLLGAFHAWRIWRAGGAKDRLAPVLFGLAASVGLGSAIFHAYPTAATLWVDLVPIQVFGLAYLGYLGLRVLRAPGAAIVAALAAFFGLRQVWLRVAPHGALGGGVTHLPALVALVAIGLYLLPRKARLGRLLLVASVSYALALLARTFDLAVCPSFPLGLHWLWHLLAAFTASLLIHGVAAEPAPDP